MFRWVHEAITDDTGRVDVAYLSLMGVGGTIMGAVPFMCLMSWLAWWRCSEACTFDPQPLGTAIGIACGGFATALAGLAGYMAATRNQPTRNQYITATGPTQVSQVQPAEQR